MTDLHSFRIDDWTRYESGGVPIWFNGDKPDWFVPNRAGDGLLASMKQDGQPCTDLQAQRFLHRLPQSATSTYSGRSDQLNTRYLRELWFHITNRCNQTCTHCLFACSPKETEELKVAKILEIGGQAAELGCRVFALTGGEPIVHPGVEEIIDGLLTLPEAHVVVLTNAVLLRRHAEALDRWPQDRFHLQVSMDGMQEQHDRIRGQGAFGRLTADLDWLRSRKISFTISMSVGKRNVEEMPRVVDLAADSGAEVVHFMWHLVRGRGEQERFAEPQRIFEMLVRAAERAESHGIGIDNLDVMKTQVFAPSGTIHDGSSAGWESAAVGPDGKLYPSPALIGIGELASDLDGNLASSWRESAILDRLRESTAAGLSSPLKFVTGGGDSDHSFVNAGIFVGKDPYVDLYEKLALWLIAREASRQPEEGPPRLRLKMGDILESCGAHGNIALAHSNCLLSLAQPNARTVVKEFYTKAAIQPKENILNPVCYPEEMIDHIPSESRVRSYGCGSPVLDAGIHSGQVVVDLGSGSGVECFIASRLVGPKGEVIGVDMLEPMLALAQKGAKGVAEKLGFGNLQFVRSYLEELELESASADVVLSNCVINLSKDKRRTFAEILRVLKPGGRLVVSDVVCETEPDTSIRNDDVLRGECIGGALTQKGLFALLEETGFVSNRVLQRYPYRVVRDHPFFSMTFEAIKPGETRARSLMYRGPFAGLITRGGDVLPAGVTVDTDCMELQGTGDHLIEFDEQGFARNAEMKGCASCATAPEDSRGAKSCCGSGEPSTQPEKKFRSGCMLCGADLQYLKTERVTECVYCGQEMKTQALCENGHFVCDACHVTDGLAVVGHICLTTEETDMIALMRQIRSHPSIPVHGPEHHAMVPGIVLATCRNLGGSITDENIKTGIARGAKVPGGACGFMGTCGGAVGVGIAFGIILESNPLKAKERATLHAVTQEILAEISKYEAARCCQRDCYLSLKAAARLSLKHLPCKLEAKETLVCEQMDANDECIGAECPVFAGE